ncbi:hypothetical protein [Atopomonas sediminilitoris]|uniref:hypothetical protein n=1 Tax=Atopomonas sediminilitoris TaxID=2919919 RepID=UPI001F4EEEE7|nr:hypothetical protein [Atopomonas sediminilitoris]MCJ8169755.1 hypothetical protein [Atopomonas sediminilitoris]
MRRLSWITSLLLGLVCASVQAADIWYLGQKIPDPQQPWRAADYALLRESLSKIDTNQPDALPRRSGQYTGAIYRRLISEENFRYQLNIYTPLELRQYEAQAMLNELKELMRVYFNFRAKFQPYGSEALGLMSYSLRQQAVQFTLTVEYWTTLAQAEQQNPGRLDGLAQTKQAAAMLTSSALDYLGLTSQFSHSDLSLYSHELAALMPELYVHLETPARDELRARLTQLSDEHPLPEVKKALSELLPVLQNVESDLRQKSAEPVQAPAQKAAPRLDLKLEEGF